MSKGETAFSVIVRLVLLGAFGSFLFASINHVAFFYSDFEPSKMGVGSYGLAVAIDGTALILTIGLMFYGKKMKIGAKCFIWFFIIGLTGFSWVVNWEYAVAYQGAAMTSHLPAIWRDINPVLASSFAFLNLAYAIVAEVFTTREKSIAELKAELADLTGEKAQLLKQIAENKGPSLVTALKEKALEIKEAATEVLSANAPEINDQGGQLRAKNDQPEAANFAQNSPAVMEERTYQDMLNLAADFLQQSPYASDESLAEVLELNRPEAARFWRLKVLEIFGQNLYSVSQETAASSAPETDQPEAITNPALYSIELPEADDQNATLAPDIQGINGGHLTDINTPNQGQPEAAASSAPAPTRQEKPAKQFTGLTYREAANLPVCKAKSVTASDIRAAVKSGACRCYKDKSVSTHAIEEWVKSLQPVA